MGLPAEECVLVAAHGWAIAGALWAGWRAAFLSGRALNLSIGTRTGNRRTGPDRSGKAADRTGEIR